jgi:subtilisin family serine protease
VTRSLLVLAVLAALALAAFPAGASAVTVKDRYIVVLKDSADSDTVARDHARSYGVQDAVVYGTAIEGYAGRVPPGKLDAIRSDPRVAYVEPDGIVQATTTQSNATWGLDRTDQRALPLSTTFTYFNTGSGVTAYIIDTGIRFSHAQFGGRASSGYDAVDGGSADDCDGHGTHVAGTVGGSTYGVAKGVSLKAVRVLNCSGSGTWSGVIAGINWATQDHIAVGTPAVANMSLGGGASSSVDTAVRNSINAGVSYAIAAGNGNQGGKEQDACKYSPARVTEAMTIGATDRTDTKPRWSNYGTCVDWFAPGVSITSAWVTSDTASSTISGTSMATPHTAGVAALYLQSNASASPTAVRTALFNNTTKNIVKSSKTTNAHLLFTNY